VEKQIPSSNESGAKGVRLRDAARLLRELPLDRPATEAEWDELTGGLTNDEVGRLSALAEGHLERAVEAEKPGDALEEAAAAVLLRPRDAAWARTVVARLRERRLAGDEAHAFYAAVDRRTGGRRTAGGRWPKWLFPVLAAAILVPAAVLAFLLVPGLALGGSPKAGVGPRPLDSSVDTQGVRANYQVTSSRLEIYPEATVAELSAWVSFPDHRVDLWEGTVAVLDPQGQVLASRDVTFRASNQGPVDPGQGVEVFQQFDAWPWFDRAASIQLSTTRIVARETKPRNRSALAFGGKDLSPGWNLKVWQTELTWSERFASRVAGLQLEVENAGLKPFADLQLALRWVAPDGSLLKTQTFRPVSAFRTALPAGARLPWTQEAVFDTEVFPWAPGAEPHPVLELTEWQ